MTLAGGNGGFPEPPAGEPVRTVRCSHLSCGSDTRIRLPRHLPPEAVRRVVCDGCGRTYDCHLVEEVAADGRAAGAPDASGGWLSRPPGRGWRIVSIPIAAVAVVGALLLIRPLQGEEAVVEQADVEDGDSTAGAADEARLVREPTFTLALPPGWTRTDPPSGSTFSARSSDGTADATLFIERDPGLDFPRFEARSLRELRRTAGSAEVANRVTGPTIERTVTRLRSKSSSDDPAYEVTLRASGPYRYYLLTTLQPGAHKRARSGAELIHSSFLPGRQ